jgi:hypothetical protein
MKLTVALVLGFAVAAAILPLQTPASITEAPRARY